MKRVHVHEVDGLLLALGLRQDGPEQGRGCAEDDGVSLQRDVAARNGHVRHRLTLAELFHQSEENEIIGEFS